MRFLNPEVRDLLKLKIIDLISIHRNGYYTLALILILDGDAFFNALHSYGITICKLFKCNVVTSYGGGPCIRQCNKLLFQSRSNIIVYFNGKVGIDEYSEMSDIVYEYKMKNTRSLYARFYMLRHAK